jgi:hypothetical protein
MSLLHAEYLKLSRRRIYPLMVVILAIFIGLAAFFLLALGQIAPEIAEDVPVLDRPEAYVVGAQQVASQTWFALILAVVVLGGELATTAWATALTRDARRVAHIAARAIVFVVASWLAMLVATAGWAVFVTIVSPGEGSPGLEGWLDIFWRLGLIQLAWVTLGMGVIASLRSIGPALGAAIGFSFIESLFALWGPYEAISLTAASTGLFQVGDQGFFDAFVPGGDLSTAHAVAIVLGWSVFGLLLTWWGLQRRDA